MFSLDNPRWKSLTGGYGLPYDASVALRLLEKAEDEKQEKTAWAELWEELYHQGDLGEASYAVVPHLVRIAQTRTELRPDYFSFIAVVELARYHPGNPEIPLEGRKEYEQALQELTRFAGDCLHHDCDYEMMTAIFAAIAAVKGERELALALLELDPDTARTFLVDRIGYEPDDMS